MIPKFSLSPRQWTYVAAAGVVGVTLLAAAIFVLSHDVDTLRDAVKTILEAARGTPWSYPIVCGMYLITSLVMFPIMALNLATAMVFGPVYGFLYALSGTLLNAVVYFSIGRFGRNRGLRKFLAGPRLSLLDRKLQEAGVIGVAMLRLVPMAPFGLFNVLAGITSLRFADFIAGTFIAFCPGGVARAVVGDSLMQLFLNPTRTSFLYLLAGGALWLSVVLGLHFGLRKFKAGRIAVMAASQGAGLT